MSFQPSDQQHSAGPSDHVCGMQQPVRNAASSERLHSSWGTSWCTAIRRQGAGLALHLPPQLFCPVPACPVSERAGPRYFWLTPRTPSLPSSRSHFGISRWKACRLQLERGARNKQFLLFIWISDVWRFSTNKFWAVNRSGMWCCGF